MEIKIKKENEIELFNDIFYGSCYYMTLFNLLKFYNRNIYRFLAYDTYYYDASYFMRCKKEKRDMDILKAEGIDVVFRSPKEDVVDCIKKSINGNRVAVIEVDTFFESFRKDTYKLKHNPSAILIYGFNDERNIFYCVEHTITNSLSYQTLEISSEDIRLSYKGFVDNFLKDSDLDYCFYDCYLTSDLCRDEFDYKSELMRNLKVNFSLISNGIRELREILEDIFRTVTDEERLNKDISDLIDRTNKFINAKQIDAYRFKDIFLETGELMLAIDDCIRSFNILRVTLTRYRLTRKYSAMNFIKLKENLDDIYSNEKKYIEALKKNI